MNFVYGRREIVLNELLSVPMRLNWRPLKISQVERLSSFSSYIHHIDVLRSVIQTRFFIFLEMEYLYFTLRNSNTVHVQFIKSLGLQVIFSTKYLKDKFLLEFSYED